MFYFRDVFLYFRSKIFARMQDKMDSTAGFYMCGGWDGGVMPDDILLTRNGFRTPV